MIGKSIAHYRITEEIGQGGMGEVYRATDTKLNREVALKVLPEAFVSNRERMARFSREAQVLASLSHPNIAAIHGLEESEGTPALVLELVEGETLAERIQKGPLPLAEALGIACQIAEALEAAHEAGVIHRDLKPANVKITPEGSVKVLDFGLAKALEAEKPEQDAANSPTISMAATQAGIILGTAAYMSPEQARGEAVDRRADIWAFGVVLFEMISGKQGFTGKTVSETMAAVMLKEPEWDQLPPLAPRIRRLLTRCLQKEPRSRIRDIADARLSIEEYLANPEEEVAAAPPSRLPWVWAAVATAGLAVMLVSALWPAGTGEARPSRRLKVQVTQDAPLFSSAGPAMAISPDGTRLAYITGTGVDNIRLHSRALDQLEGILLSGTESAYNPFFSPDGQWIGFVTPSQIKKVSVTGGTPLTLCEVALSRGADWGPDDSIVFAGSPTSGLSRIPASGGTPEAVTDLREGEATHRWPHFLPDGRALIFISHTQNTDFDSANIELLDLDTGRRKLLHQGGSYARYVGSGHIVYAREGTLFALPFDASSREVTGTPSPVLEEVGSNPANHGSAQFAFSGEGTLVYLSGSAETPTFSIMLVDRHGQSTPLTTERRTYAEPRFSPDGTRLALEILDATNADAWVFDLKRSVFTRLTFEDSQDDVPVWSPDGQYLAFSSTRGGGPPNLYRKRSDGSGDVERLTESERSQFVSSWSPDGRYLLMSQANPGSAEDLYVLSLDGEGQAEAYLATPFAEAEAAFSPDGRWVAYQSNESGQAEIYVRPFPASGGKWQVSVGGGTHPRWSRDGRELYYRTDDGVSAVPVEGSGQSFLAEKPVSLFQGSFGRLAVGGVTYADYDVSPEGRFAMFQGSEETTSHTHLTLVTRWFEELRRMVPGR